MVIEKHGNVIQFRSNSCARSMYGILWVTSPFVLSLASSPRKVLFKFVLLNPLPSVRTNYGKFNLRFIGAKIWNTISDDKKRMPKHSFKEAIKSNLLNSY